MTDQESNTTIEDQKSAQPLLFGFVVLLIVASIFLIGLGLGFGMARWTGDSAVASTVAVGGVVSRLSDRSVRLPSSPLRKPVQAAMVYSIARSGPGMPSTRLPWRAASTSRVNSSRVSARRSSRGSAC